MRVLFITPRFLPEIGGVEKHVYHVSRRLTANGYAVTILTGTRKSDLVPNEPIDGIPVYRINLSKGSKGKFKILRDVLSVWHFIIRNFQFLINTDVIHFHDVETFLWFSPIILLIRKPFFITFHGFEGYPIPKVTRIFRKISEKMVDGNICVGQFITKWYGTKATYMTLGGVDSSELNSEFSAEFSAVFVGRLTEDTSINEYIDALRTLQEQYGIKLPLHVCGDGPLRCKIEDFAKKNNLQIFLHGFVKNPERYVFSCRFAFVSGYLSILEAMSLKKPVFSIYRNNLKKDYLYSIPNAQNIMFLANSSKQLAQKINSVVTCPDVANQLVENAYVFANEHTWEKVAQIYQKLYEN